MTTRTFSPARYGVVIIDSLSRAWGVPLWIIDTQAVEKLAKSGIKTPGVTVTEVETLAAKG